MLIRLRRPLTAGLLAAVLAAAALLVPPASPAYAHNALRKATPAQDAELTTPPSRITLEFMQKLNPSLTTITLSDAGKQKVATGEPDVTGAKGTVTIEAPLANGTYTVGYRVVSADGHPVQGSYKFTVADPTATAEPTPSATPAGSEPAATPSAAPTSAAAASPAASGSSGGSGTVAPLAGVLVALVAGAAVVLLRRRRAGGGAAEK
ncbi:copper resistance protein CopC [Micromonospora sp. Llam7]|uniref:copper resistance CopC family protein n=1 Tax=Micromonospora tarapacensis TaxID=2835305 RepID=UPI001C83D7F7|nr:copper resistance CopC family protein [Micromonospora tarapacensis]MBX7269362.1 copper resistance protein CopC [Micromonospora tarapacensis]